jgi:hypothetical protein
MANPADLASGAPKRGREMSTFSDLASQPRARIVVAVDLQAADRATGELSKYRLTDAARLITLTTDDPPNEAYRAVLTTGARTSRAMTDGPTFTGPAPPNRATFSVHNGGDRPLGNWRDKRWTGQPVTVRAGGVRTATGAPYPFSEFETYFTGTIRQEPTGAAGQIVNFECVGATAVDSSLPVVEESYRALGGAVRLYPPDGLLRKLSASIAAPLTWELLGRVDALPNTDGALFRFGANFELRILTDGKLSLRTTGSVFTDTDLTVTAGQELYAAATLGADLQTVNVYAGSSSLNIRQVASTTVPTVSLAPSDIRFGRVGAVDPLEVFDVTVYESRLWSSVLTLEELITGADAPTEVSAPNLVELWKFEEGTGSVAFGSLGVHDLDLFTGADFASSLEGDDPARGGSILGKTKPRTWGASAAVPLAWVDSQTNQAQWSITPSTDVRFLDLDGGHMLPNLAFETANDGDLSWDDAGPTGGAVVLLPGLGYDFRRFVPGQGDPVILGQLVDVLPNVGGGGDYSEQPYRVAAVSVDGLRVDLVDILGDPLVGLPSASFLAGSTFQSAETESIFEVDYARSVVTLTRSPGGQLTIDPISEGGELLLASTAFASVAGASVDTSRQAVDPVVGFTVAPGEDVTKGQLLDALAASCFGWRSENRQGGHVLGTYQVPAGPAVAALIGSKPLELEGRSTSLPAVVGTVVNISEQSSVPPYWQVRVGYDKTWQTLERPVGVLSDVDRQRRTTTWREVRRTFPAVRSVPGTDAMAEPLPTFIVGRDEAVAVTDQVAAPILSSERRWLELEVVGLPALFLELGDEVLVEHPDPDFGLADPVFAVVWSIDEDTASNVTTVGVYL